MIAQIIANQKRGSAGNNVFIAVAAAGLFGAWFAYGALAKDHFIVASDGVGTSLAIILVVQTCFLGRQKTKTG